MLTIHDRIEEFLAADLHDELSEAEREELHTHLMECAACRLLHKEEQIINKVIQSTLEHAKPPFGFEQRTLAAFRNRVPYRNRNVMRFVVNAMRSRATQVAAVAAVLLALLQLGRLLTGETNIKPSKPVVASVTNKEIAGQAQPSTSFTAHARVLTDEEAATDKLRAAAPPAEPLKAAKVMAAPAERASTEAMQKSAPELREQTASSAPDERFSSSEGASPEQTPAPAAPSENRKLIRNANLDLEVRSFDEALQSITTLAAQADGYIATTNSQKQENGKLRGEVIVKVLPENLDDFLAKLRELGELKNQTLTTQDVGRQYFDTEARLRNARVVEQRLVDMLEKNTGKVSDLLQVEKELGRVREQIEQMQGELKFMDTQVQFATVVIRLAEKDMNVPAGFLVKERVQLALFTAEVEKVYANIRALASPAVQITNAALDRDDAGRVFARISMLIAPEESDDIINKIRAMGRVGNFQVQSERVARGGQGMAPEARTEYDKVELNITITREDDELARQQTTLSIRAADVNDETRRLRELAEKAGGRIRSSAFSRDPNGVEYATVSLRVPLRNYAALMQSLATLGKLENISVHREDRPGEQIDEQNAPADVNVQVYSQGNIVSQESGLVVTLRRTLGQSVAALMWSVRMIGVALASIAPWVIVLGIAIGLINGVRRSRRTRAP